MKDPHVLSLSPMYHWTGHSMRVHVFTCVLALQLAHLMRHRARQAGLDLSVRELLARLAAIGETVLVDPSTTMAGHLPQLSGRTFGPCGQGGAERASGMHIDRYGSGNWSWTGTRSILTYS